MFQLIDVTITHNKDNRVLLRDFKLSLEDGDKAVIIGEEGSGKSTLLKWIVDPSLVEDYVKVDGKRQLQGELLGYLPQELPEELREQSVLMFLNSQLSYIEAEVHILRDLILSLGIDETLLWSEQTMESLSGGERIKIQLLALLLEEPSALVLDEPTNDLDIDTLEFLEVFLLSFPGKILFISHDETLIERVANKVIHLEHVEGKLTCRHSVASMSFDDYARERKLHFKKQERKAFTDRREKIKRDEKLRKVFDKVHRAQQNISRKDPQGGRLLKKKMHAVKSMESRFKKEDLSMTKAPEEEQSIFFKLGHESEPLAKSKRVLDLQVEELRSPAGRLLSKDIRLQVYGNEKMAIIGDNGTGKTTLLKLIEKELEQNNLEVMSMPQNYLEALNSDQSPISYVSKLGSREELSRIRTYLASLQFTLDEMDHPMRELSGGQKGKVLLLELSLSKAQVLILDEPTRNFSPLSGEFIRGIFRDFPGAIISVSHDRKYLDEVCDTYYQLTPQGFNKL